MPNMIFRDYDDFYYGGKSSHQSNSSACSCSESLVAHLQEMREDKKEEERKREREEKERARIRAAWKKETQPLCDLFREIVTPILLADESTELRKLTEKGFVLSYENPHVFRMKFNGSVDRKDPLWKNAARHIFNAINSCYAQEVSSGTNIIPRTLNRVLIGGESPKNVALLLYVENRSPAFRAEYFSHPEIMKMS